MFYYIKGILAYLDAERAVIEAGGVGYSLCISASTAQKLSAKLGETVTVYTAMGLKDELPELYGFYTEDELKLFKSLITVSGIGPKGAISILGSMTGEQLIAAISAGDHKLIARAPGIGAKTAQKIVLELGDRIRKNFGAPSLPYDAPATGGDMSAVVDTLIVYGFKREQIEKALCQVDRTLPLEELLGETLKVLGKM